MKTKWLLLFVTLTASVSSCKKYVPPKVELCGYVKKTGRAACDDPRRPKNAQTYFRELENGDLITRPESFEKVKAYCTDLRTKLLKTEIRLNRCEKQRR